MIPEINRSFKGYDVNEKSEKGAVKKKAKEQWIEMKDLSSTAKKVQDVAKVKTLMLLPYLAEEELKPGDILLSYYPNSYGLKIS